MMRNFALKIKGSRFAPILVGLGIRKSSIARKVYGPLIKKRTDKPVKLGEYTMNYPTAPRVCLRANPPDSGAGYQIKSARRS